MRDLPGNFLRTTPAFRGKQRLREFWESYTQTAGKRMARLPDGSTVEVDMGIPYERMVWLQDEKWGELQHLQFRLCANDVMVDVGANIGLWTLVAASAVGAQERVFSFEPNPATYRKLTANIARNGRESVITAFPKAVSRTEGTVSFHCPAHHNLASISEDPNAVNAVAVPAVALDTVLKGVKIAGMKLDTEGHELSSLEGALQTIKACSPWLMVKFNTTLLPSRMLADWSVHRFLSALGYHPFVYQGAVMATPIDGAFSVPYYCNILFERIKK